jgi:hypothetical protein
VNTRLDCTLPIPFAWPRVEQVRREVAESLATVPGHLRDAAVMTSSELAENVVKYGAPHQGRSEGKLHLRVDGVRLVVASENAVADAAQVDRVMEHLARIQHADDARSLYVERLAELLENPDQPASGLGLFRIAFEGGFALSAHHDAGVLTITASRELA